MISRVPCAAHFWHQRGSPKEDTLISGQVDWTPRKEDGAFLRLQDDFGKNSFYEDPRQSASQTILAYISRQLDSVPINQVRGL